MDLYTVLDELDARSPAPWRPGDAWLGGGTYLFSEPQPHLRRLVDLSRMGWEPVRELPDGSLETAATCTIAQLSRFGRTWQAGGASRRAVLTGLPRLLQDLEHGDRSAATSATPCPPDR